MEYSFFFLLLFQPHTKVRWAQSVETLGLQIDKLIGDVFISAGKNFF